MINDSDSIHVLQNTLELPCGVILKNRLAKPSMSDSLAGGEGDPTEAQIRLYERWDEIIFSIAMTEPNTGSELRRPHNSPRWGGWIEALPN